MTIWDEHSSQVTVKISLLGIFVNRAEHENWKVNLELSQRYSIGEGSIVLPFLFFFLFYFETQENCTSETSLGLKVLYLFAFQWVFCIALCLYGALADKRSKADWEWAVKGWKGKGGGGAPQARGSSFHRVIAKGKERERRDWGYLEYWDLDGWGYFR